MARADEELSLDIVVQGMRKFLSDMDRADGAIGGTAKKWGGLSAAAGGAGKVLATVAKVGIAAVVTGATAAAAAVGGLAIVVGKLALQAAPLEGIGIAFDKMAADAGLALEDLREASAGTISDFELMRAANLALTGAGEELGAEFGENLPGLLEIARAAARATGQDVGFLFQSLVTGIKRTSPMLIDNTGLQLKLGEANAALAVELGKTVDELTAEERQIALLNATMAAGQSMVDDFGGGQATAAEQLAQFRTAIQNTKDQIGLAFLPALQALLQPLGELATKVGPQLVEWAKIAGEWLGVQLPLAIGELSALLRGDLSDSLGGLFAWFTTNLPTMQKMASTAWEAIRDVVMAVVDVIMQDVWPSLQEAFASIGEIMATLGIEWSDVWRAMGVGIKFAAGVIIAVVLVLTSIVIGFANMWTKSLAFVTKMWSDWAAAFKQVIEGVAGMIGGIMAVIRGIFTGDTKLILAGLKGWAKGVLDLVTGLMKAMWTGIKLTFGSILVLVSGFIEGVINFFKSLYDRLVGGSLVPEMMSMMLSIITLGLELIDLIWTIIWEGIYAFLSATWDRIVSAVTTKVQAVYMAVHDKIEALKTWWKTAWDRIGEMLKAAWAAMVVAVKEKAQAIYNAVVDAINSVKDWVGGQVSAFYDLGRDLLQSMVDGVMSAIQWLIDVIVGAIQAAIDAARDAVGASSPSRVFAKIGREMMAGMALGVADFAPVVQAQITAAVRPPMVGGTTNVTNNYNLTTQAITRPGGLRLEFDSMALATR